MTRLTSHLDILTNVSASIILLHDFNLPSIRWSNPLLSPPVLNPTDVFIDFVQRNAMHQLVSDITRHNSNDLDKEHVSIWSLQTIFLQFQIYLLPMTSTPVITILSFKITTSIPTYCIQTYRYDFTNANWSGISNCLFCIDWQSAFVECPDIPAQFDLWNDKLTETIRLFIPVKTHYSNSGAGPNRYPLHIRKLLSKKALSLANI